MIGRVVSIKMLKTATVLVTSTKTHPLYKKSFVRSKKYLADDPIGVNLGDLVEIIKTRPTSKRKHWKITKVVGRDIEAVVKEELKEAAIEAIEEVMPVEPEDSDPSSVLSHPSSENRKKKKGKDGSTS